VSGSAIAADQASEALFKDATQKVDAGDYVGALDSFRAAYARTKKATALLGVATMLKNLGRFAEASDAYEQYLADPQMNPAKKAEVKETLRDSLTRVATLRFDAEPNARVTVDAREVKDPARVDAGAHVVIADDGNGTPITAQIVVKAGEERTVSLRRKATEAPPAVAGTEAKPEPKAPSDTGGGSKTLGYVVGGVGVVGLGLAGLSFAMVRSNKNDIPTSCDSDSRVCHTPDVATANGAATSAGKWTTPFYVGLAVGAVGVASGSYLILSSKSGNVGLSIAPDGASVRGRF
jgi:hypothetical protein